MSARPHRPGQKATKGPAPVSVVIASLDDRDLLERHLPPLFAELARRGAGDEVIVVDDTGTGALAPWVQTRFPAPAHPLRVLVRETNGGFAKAMASGVEAAACELVFLMNPDVLVHPGFLEPLVEALADEAVHSAVPRLLLFGKPDAVESATGVRLVDDIAEVDQPGLCGGAAAFGSGTIPVTYGVGGALLVRRSEFLKGGGFDPLYEPFYYEDLDLGFAAWRAGRRVVLCADSVAEHHHRGTIRRRVDEDLVRAVIERNRLLFQWRFLEGGEAARRHLAALLRMAVDGQLREAREELVWLAMALERLGELAASKERLGPPRRDYLTVVRESAPRAPEVGPPAKG